jgi:hypothetical protein
MQAALLPEPLLSVFLPVEDKIIEKEYVSIPHTFEDHLSEP